VLPPYAPDEVAQAVIDGLATAGCRIVRLTVTANDLRKEWRLEAKREDGREVVVRHPFSTPQGIAVPAEIADWCVERLARDA